MLFGVRSRTAYSRLAWSGVEQLAALLPHVVCIHARVKGTCQLRLKT